MRVDAQLSPNRREGALGLRTQNLRSASCCLLVSYSTLAPSLLFCFARPLRAIKEHAVAPLGNRCRRIRRRASPRDLRDSGTHPKKRDGNECSDEYAAFLARMRMMESREASWGDHFSGGVYDVAR